MTVKNLQLFSNVDFEKYRQLPGFSYSSFKSFPADFSPTYKMKLGTAVDQYLTEPEKYNGFEYDFVRKAAQQIKERIGPLWKHLQKQVSIAADFEHEGYTMPYKGRPDFCIPRKLVIDLKVVDDRAAIEHFGYHNQLSGYALAINAPVALILELSRKRKTATFVPVRITPDFWITKTLLHGRLSEVPAK